jgi:anaerobic magnesium-protoporphyrin IX monomethyl ester cyclase
MIYGGVFPTYHWREILLEEPQIDIVVRGEGEETCRLLVRCLASGSPLVDVPGIAWRDNGSVRVTSAAPIIHDLDAYRVGWELIDHRRYTYWGGRRAVGVQFSRGCPHRCTFCGQRIFWNQWRHRDPVRFAAELARLHRQHGVEVINFADENPTTSRQAWEQFLRALVAENVPLRLVGSTRADAIVRDADLLPLYKQAGFERFLLGTESMDEATLRQISKGSSTTTDRQAVRLLQQHGIIALVTYAVGFEEESDRDYWRSLRQLLALDADQISVVYATPHRWTEFCQQSAHRRVIQLDRRWWDYKHQVLEVRRVPAWRVFCWVKLIEAVVQLRPKSLWRTWAHPDPRLRPAMRWYGGLGRQVWPAEIRNFFFREKRTRNGPTVAEFWEDSPTS